MDLKSSQNGPKIAQSGHSASNIPVGPAAHDQDLSLIWFGYVSLGKVRLGFSEWVGSPALT